MERALAEAAPLERLERTVRSSEGDRTRLRNLHLQAPGGMGGTMPGTDPIGALLRKAGRD